MNNEWMKREEHGMRRSCEKEVTLYVKTWAKFLDGRVNDKFASRCARTGDVLNLSEDSPPRCISQL